MAYSLDLRIRAIELLNSNEQPRPKERGIGSIWLEKS